MDFEKKPQINHNQQSPRTSEGASERDFERVLSESMRLQESREYNKYERRHTVNRPDNCCGYIGWIFRSGGFVGSVFSLIAATLGTGVISFGYAIMKNGYVMGPIYVVLGALLSIYSGMLIVKAVNHTGKRRLEDIALAAYGPVSANLVSVFNIICLVGFVFSYITFVKNELCDIVNQYASEDAKILRKYFSTSIVEGHKGIGDYVWGCIYTYVILLPMSLPRQLNSLRFSSVFGVLCSMYLALAVMFLFLTDFDKEIIPSKSENFHQMEAFKFEFSGISGAFPLIIFAYMYQVNVPALYSEME